MDILEPQWPVANHIRSFVTQSGGSDTASPYGAFNLAAHVGDNFVAVEQNRTTLKAIMGWQHSPIWLEQVHGNKVINADTQAGDPLVGDGLYTQNPEMPCLVLTADCLPILVASRVASEVAAVHAGWRGLVAGVLESALDYFHSPRDQLMLWLGPAIGPSQFEVGSEVRDTYLERSEDLSKAFKYKSTTGGDTKWLLDIYLAATMIANQQGVERVFGGGLCTFSDERFFSYRRDKITGRFATGIWISAA